MNDQIRRPRSALGWGDSERSLQAPSRAARGPHNRLLTLFHPALGPLSGCHSSDVCSGGIAALHPRLMAGNLSGWRGPAPKKTGMRGLPRNKTPATCQFVTEECFSARTTVPTPAAGLRPGGNIRLPANLFSRRAVWRWRFPVRRAEPERRASISARQHSVPVEIDARVNRPVPHRPAFVSPRECRETNRRACPSRRRCHPCWRHF